MVPAGTVLTGATVNKSWKGRRGPGRRGEERKGKFEFIHIKGTFYNVGKNKIYINENIYYSFLYLGPQKSGHISIRYNIY